MGKERLKPNVVVHRTSPNQSSRGGVSPQLIVIHDTESYNRTGPSDLAAIGALFASSSREASSHVCTDADGNSARFVEDGRKAWHCVYYNSVSLGIEQIGLASQTQWPDKQIKETARWVAEWSIKHNIPIRKGRTVAGRVVLSGVVTHRSLGTAGGGHWDPGYHYPMKKMLRLARHYKKERQRNAK